jgi:predicted alpha/beta-hydrolase family hydrolase
LIRPTDAWAIYVLAHGAGAGMRHAFLERIADDLAGAGVATLRYQFPYTEHESIVRIHRCC